MNHETIIWCSVGIALLLTFIVIPQVINVSLLKRLHDKPDGRKIHNGIIPRLGGLSFLPVILITFGIVLSIGIGNEGAVSADLVMPIERYLPSVAVLFGAMGILYLVGLNDDIVGLKYFTKLTAQILSGILIVSSGLYIADFDGLFGIEEVGAIGGAALTCFLIVYIINALNLIDGIDGLASGMSIVAFVGYGIMLYTEGFIVYSILSWIGVGTVGAFFMFNVFGKKRKHTKIFMGDIGSLTIGLLLAFMVIVIGNFPESVKVRYNPILYALSPLMLPLFDLIRVFLVRLAARKSPFLPDKRHIHHVMMNSGISPALVLIWLLIVQIGIIVANIYISPALGINWTVLIDLAIYLVVLSVCWGWKRLVKNK